jgi:hypothetical protein
VPLQWLLGRSSAMHRIVARSQTMDRCNSVSRVMTSHLGHGLVLAIHARNTHQLCCSFAGQTTCQQHCTACCMHLQVLPHSKLMYQFCMSLHEQPCSLMD